MRHIFIYTSLFPYSKMSESFLTGELNSSREYNFNITIVPIREVDYIRDIPEWVRIDNSICRLSFNKRFLTFVYIFVFLRGVSLTRCLSVIRAGYLKNALKYLYAASLVYRDIKKRASINESCIFYSYWLSYPPIAFSIYKEKHPDTPHKFIARGHGSDIYSEDLGIYYPMRNIVFTDLDRIFPISQFGLEYIKNKYQVSKEKLVLSRLGVDDNYSVKPYDDCIRVVSCSSVIPLKRVDLIFKSLCSYAEKHNNNSIEWVHFGGGLLFQHLLKSVSCHPDNLTIHLKGSVDNKEILEYYRTTPVNCFILLSTSEGVPVSIMEALASGIPVIATNVGGVSEIVNKSTGVLLNVLFKQKEFDDALDYILINRKNLSDSSHDFFLKNYFGPHNYNSFFVEIQKL